MMVARRAGSGNAALATTSVGLIPRPLATTQRAADLSSLYAANGEFNRERDAARLVLRRGRDEQRAPNLGSVRGGDSHEYFSSLVPFHLLEGGLQDDEGGVAVY